jgi:hypothetical protein
MAQLINILVVIGVISLISGITVVKCLVKMIEVREKEMTLIEKLNTKVNELKEEIQRLKK